MRQKTMVTLSIILIIILGIFLGYKKLKRPAFKIPKEKTKEAKTLKHSIPLNEILDGGPGKDGIPSIDNPKFISPVQAKSELELDGPGLVVSIGSDSRFYPYQILVWHEIVNDTVGGKPVLVSFCPLCNSGIVFERRVSGEAVEFGVSGKLYNSDLLMYDHKTQSLWSQITGEAVVGGLTGTKLVQVEAGVISLQTFINKFPSGEVLSKDTGFSRDYSRNPYENYSKTNDTLFPVKNSDSRLSPKAIIYGIEVNGKFKAYPESILKLKGVISDTINNHEIVLQYNDGLIAIKDNTAGTNILSKPSFWFAWAAFHPDTEFYK